MRTVVYTAIFGGRDSLTDPDFINPDFTYVCFTDNDECQSGVWEIRHWSLFFLIP